MRIVVIADLHIGHVRALTPRGWFNKDNTNDFQKWIIEQWENFTKKYKNPDYLILNGDLADGSQVKSLGVEAITTSLDFQEDMAVELIRPLIGSKTKIFGLNGSGYHGGKGQGTCMDRRITEALGGQFKGNIFELEIGEELIQFAHGSGGGIANPDTYIRRELQLAQKNANRRRGRCPTLLIRSHGHLFLVSGDSVATIYMSPSWEYQSEYMEMRTANMTPDIGALIIDIEDGIAKVYPILYPIPQEIIESMRSLEDANAQIEKERKKKDFQVLKETLKKKKF